jgi:diguanylate cyclase (GGDEF)-like protein/PAS domain S-box-containing protein
MDAADRELGGNGFSEPATDHGGWEFELASRFCIWSEGVYRIHGVEAGSFEPTMESMHPLLHPEDAGTYAELFHTAIAARQPFSLKHRIVRPDGEERTVMVRGAFVEGDGSRPDRYVGTTEDISGRLSYEERLWQLANRDPLTGLFNRRRFREELAREVAFARRRGEKGALLIFDIDSFKDINDSLGHPAGDALLARMGEYLEGRIRATDTLARIGGDEFALILPGCGMDEARSIAVGLVKDLARGPNATVAGKARPVTAGVGVAPFGPGAERTAEALLVEADLAMYRAKGMGPGNGEVFDQEMRGQLATRMEIEGELREALERGDLLLHYQPITSMPDGVAIGCEALVRWHHPERGLMPPAHFIPVAEDSGLIVEVGAWVLEEACRQAESWRRRGRHLHVSVNVSPVQLLRDDVAGLVTRTLQSTGLPPQLLYIEVTESSLIDDAGRIAPALQVLRDLGVKIAIDDFGGGSSSLSYLSVLPVDVIKIDRLFIDGLPESSDDRAIVSAVLSLAQELDLAVIAEGVENDRQHWELRELGCTLGQGFLYSKPKPAGELELDGFSTDVQPGVGDPSTIREFMRQIGIPARVGA